MKVFFADFKRMFLFYAVFIGSVGIAAAGFFGVFDQVLSVFQNGVGMKYPIGYSIQIVISALQTDVVFLVLPILAALPFTTAFIDDYKSRYIREVLPRTSRRSYIASKVSVTLLSGGVVIFIGVLLICLVFTVIFSPFEVAMSEADNIAEIVNTIDVSAQYTFVDLMSRMCMFFLSGCLWALIGGVFAVLTMNKYMAYAAPFIFFYVLVILAERYFKEVQVLNPKMWLIPAENFGLGALFVIELIIILSFIYGVLMKRRIRDV